MHGYHMATRTRARMRFAGASQARRMRIACSSHALRVHRSSRPQDRQATPLGFATRIGRSSFVACLSQDLALGESEASTRDMVFTHKLVLFLRPFLVSKTGPKRAKAHYAPSLFSAVFSTPKMDAFFAPPLFSAVAFWSLGSSYPGVAQQSSTHPWRKMYRFPRAPSPAHCHAKAALGVVQNRRVVIAAVALGLAVEPLGFGEAVCEL